MENKLQVMIAEDHATVREGIKLLINAQPDMAVIGEANDGDIAIAEAVRLKPDIILMDISMPGMNGLRATKKLRKLFPTLKILILTRHSDDGYLQQMISAGANGYVLKQSAPSELVNAIQVIVAGNAYLDPALTDKVMSSYAGRGTSLRGENRQELTDRESEVLRLIALGYSNKEVAVSLDLSVKTIEIHKANAMRKLGISGRIDIVRYGILQGWMKDT